MTENRAFHVMAKPSGPVCNLGCRYCFYLEKEKLYRNETDWRMPERVLEEYIRQYIDSQNTREVMFVWQGGEPTLMGLDFFDRALALQQKYSAGRQIGNAIQTNGILIDDNWGRFLSKNQFLVGLSLDGPKDIHDQYRVYKDGRPSFDKVMAALDILKKYRVDFNTLTCVHRDNADRALEIYHFLKDTGSRFLQFIPIVERVSKHYDQGTPELVSPDYPGPATLSSWSVEPRQYGAFLQEIFDEWVRWDVGRIFVQIFDVSLAAWVGQPAGLCIFEDSCGAALALEHNGDLYSCDHYVYEPNKLGNIMETPLRQLAYSKQQLAFGLKKRDVLPAQCRNCDVRFVCNGGCPKHRFATTADGEKGLNYLCESYRHFFRHIDEAMRFMAGELKAGRPPANVMTWATRRQG